MTTIQRERTAVLSVSLPKSLGKQAKKFAQREDMSFSQLVAKSLKGYIFMQEWEELRKAFRPLARKLKIKNDEDVERIFG